MPHIEELPTSSKAAAPGWSYVVDTGYDPSKLAINPSNRKRVRIATSGLSGTDLTLRQQTAIQRHLAELDKDNHKDVQIPVPKGSDGGKKQTTNVKRILQSGKDFAYYVEEEEALLAQKGGASSSAVESADTPRAASKPAKTQASRRKSALANSSAASTPAPSTPADSTGPSIPLPANAKGPAGGQQPVAIKPSPLAPAPTQRITEEEIEALLSAPPLTYNAARSPAPPPFGPPQRVFCEICGYWGRAKCMKCGARICSVTCKDTHEESRCLKF
ncbi:hypothetical protein M8818_000237 [Zalaria obscura]|uniref:Uncharacterized protein n=1 Tax=Zalaria obscura TaxID=2024903 RepID=A0ACC3SPG3_9PEZI